MGLDFPTTHWSVVAAALDGDPVRSRQALEALYLAYWRPLDVYLRYRGHGEGATRDLLPVFPIHFIDKQSRDQVTPVKGHLRSLPVTSRVGCR